MHEIALAQALVEMASDRARRADAARVSRLHCRIGALRQVEPALIQEAFEAARVGTLCQDAQLCIESVDITACCPVCRHSYVVEDWNWSCPACGVEGTLQAGGDELELVSIDAEGGP